MLPLLVPIVNHLCCRICSVITAGRAHSLQTTNVKLNTLSTLSTVLSVAVTVAAVTKVDSQAQMGFSLASALPATCPRNEVRTKGMSRYWFDRGFGRPNVDYASVVGSVLEGVCHNVRVEWKGDTKCSLPKTVVVHHRCAINGLLMGGAGHVSSRFTKYCFHSIHRWIVFL